MNMDLRYEPDITEQVVMKVSRNSIFANMLLSLFKFAAGLAASSGAMISDAVHSASDVFSTLIVIAGVKMSRKEADKEHPYGHERMECVAAILLAAVLFLTGAGIGYSGIAKIAAGDYEKLAVPGVFALAAAVVSIAVKEWMFWYTRYYAKKDRLRSADGRCVASSFGCAFLCRIFCWNIWSKNRISSHGPAGKCYNLCVYCKGCI